LWNLPHKLKQSISDYSKLQKQYLPLIVKSAFNPSLPAKSPLVLEIKLKGKKSDL